MTLSAMSLMPYYYKEPIPVPSIPYLWALRCNYGPGRYLCSSLNQSWSHSLSSQGECFSRAVPVVSPEPLWFIYFHHWEYNNEIRNFKASKPLVNDFGWGWFCSSFLPYMFTFPEFLLSDFCQVPDSLFGRYY